MEISTDTGGGKPRGNSSAAETSRVQGMQGGSPSENLSIYLTSSLSVKDKDLPSKTNLDESKVGYYGCLFQDYHATRNLQRSLPYWS